jgi:hypothetical protein
VCERTFNHRSYLLDLVLPAHYAALSLYVCTSSHLSHAGTWAGLHVVAYALGSAACVYIRLDISLHALRLCISALACMHDQVGLCVGTSHFLHACMKRAYVCFACVHVHLVLAFMNESSLVGLRCCSMYGLLGLLCMHALMQSSLG